MPGEGAAEPMLLAGFHRGHKGRHVEGFVIRIGNGAQRHCQRDGDDIHFFFEFRRKIAAAVGNDLIVHLRILLCFGSLDRRLYRLHVEKVLRSNGKTCYHSIGNCSRQPQTILN